MTLDLGELPASASPLDPKCDPDWQFTVYIPGWPRAKGSQERRYMRRGNRSVSVLVEKDIVLDWVAVVSAYAIQERRMREARGDMSFPYEGEVMLWPLFVYERPHTQPEGSPTTAQGIYAVGDLDKLIRSVGDALSPGTFSLRGERVSKAAVIKDDRMIVSMGPPHKKFRDQTKQFLPPGAHLRLTRAPDDLVDGALYGWQNV